MPRTSKWGKLPELPCELVPEAFGAWIYSRLSSENRRSEDSIETQIAFCKDYIDTQKDLVYKGFFDDVGYTGTNMNRPRFSDMMAGILSGEIKCVVVKDLSRLGRTYIEVGELLFDTFLQLGVRFISVNDNYDSFSPDAGRKKLLILVKNLQNSQYSKDISQKIESALSMNQKNGKLCGGVPPYGYWLTDDKQGYKVIPEAATVVKMIFDFYNNGMGAARICKHLNTEGFPAPRYHYNQLGLVKVRNGVTRKAWTTTSIYTMLRNKTYTGCLIQGKNKISVDGKRVRLPIDDCIVHHDKHPAIVDNETFDSVQKILFANGETLRTNKASNRENIFVGKLFCSRCGRAIWRDNNMNKQRKKVIYPTYYCFYCLPELKKANNIKSISKELRLADLEEVVFNEIRRQIEVCLDIDAMLKKATNSTSVISKRQELQSKREKLIKESEQVAGLLTAAYTHLVSGLLDDTEFSTARDKFESDKQSVLAAIAKVETQIMQHDTSKARESEYITQFRKYRGITQLNKDVINTLIKRIDITPLSNEIEISFNFKDSFDEFAELIAESGVVPSA